jgi:choline dehydrogenase-like flavoprotein
MAEVGKVDKDLAEIIWGGYDLGISGVSHQCGTLTFGNDKESSVLNTNCQLHDVPNVFVVDASFFPSCGAYNPSLTIAANSLRVADYIKSIL